MVLPPAEMLLKFDLSYQRTDKKQYAKQRTIGVKPGFSFPYRSELQKPRGGV
jgi:hypothetical protein